METQYFVSWLQNIVLKKEFEITYTLSVDSAVLRRHGSPNNISARYVLEETACLFPGHPTPKIMTQKLY